MKRMRGTLLLITLLVLLVGVVSAAEVSGDTAGSITEEAVIQDTPTVSDTVGTVQDDKVSDNKLDDEITKATDKTAKDNNLKSDATVTSWQELRSAVNALGNKTGKEATLTLGKGTYKTSGTIRWSNTNAVLTIDGNGQTIDGNKQQVFAVEKGASLVLKNITIRNAESQYGGAIRNDGTLTVTQSTITKSETSTLVGFGGAIFNNGILNITQSTFTDNRGSLGGAIFNNDSGKINIIQSTFTGNNASDEVSYGAGGAIKNCGTLTITNSTFTKGIAHTGGAIDNAGTLRITNSVMANNRAKYQGGAVYNGPVKCNIIGSNFTLNRAQEGGAIFAQGNTNLTGNIFTDNTATDNKETIDLHGYWNGIFDSNVYKSTSISLKTINLKLKDNRDTYYSGEDVVLNFTISLNHTKYYDRDILERLGDITVYVNGKKKVTTKYENYTLSNLKPGNYSVYYNTCKGTSNTVKFTVNPITNWEELSEAVHYAENRTEDVNLRLGEGDYTNTDTINWTNTNITLTIDGNGQTVDGNRQLAFYIDSDASMILRNITIQNAKSDYGGAIENQGTLTVTHSTLANNTATQYGGAIGNGQEKLTVTDSTFINNHAKQGGAIYSRGSSNITGNTFINNTADNNETIDIYRFWNGRR